jgi:hypothetical protein
MNEILSGFPDECLNVMIVFRQFILWKMDCAMKVKKLSKVSFVENRAAIMIWRNAYVSC